MDELLTPKQAAARVSALVHEAPNIEAPTEIVPAPLLQSLLLWRESEREEFVRTLTFDERVFLAFFLDSSDSPPFLKALREELASFEDKAQFERAIAAARANSADRRH